MSTTTVSTESVLASMLIENTGRHFLDSGGAYGRAWERNQAAAGDDPVEYFKSRPEAWWDYGTITLDVFHFLSSRLEYAQDLDRAFRTFVRTGPEDRYFNAPSTADAFISALEDKGWAERGTDFHGMWVNTYNNEDALSQVLQYVCLTLTGECPWGNGFGGSYVLLSIHGGCDVRGGYTGFRAFEHDPYDSYSLFDNARVGCYCNRTEEHRGVPRGQLDLDGKTAYDVYYRAYSDNAGYSWVSDEHDPPMENPDPDSDIPLCPLCGHTLEPGGF